MSEKTLWLASFRVRVLEGCPIDFDGSEFMFGEAAGFAESEAEFQAAVAGKLTENKFEPLETYHLTPAESAKWVSGNDDMADILELVEEVKFSGELGFGPFRSSNYLEVHR
ncbi:MAG: hypothetical protein K0Q67_1199 [Cellvibrio sp.]|nr:hypothetical protein [Cellvibrio sp.]